MHCFISHHGFSLSIWLFLLFLSKLVSFTLFLHISKFLKRQQHQLRCAQAYMSTVHEQRSAAAIKNHFVFSVRTPRVSFWKTASFSFSKLRCIFFYFSASRNVFLDLIKLRFIHPREYEFLIFSSFFVTWLLWASCW